MDTHCPSLPVLEERLVKALACGGNLGSLDDPATLKAWRAICKGVRPSDIDSVLPALLGRLYRSDRGAEVLATCGLLPKAGRRDLYWQALAVQIAPLGDAAPAGVAPASALESASDLAPLKIVSPETMDALREDLMKLRDAARAWERERTALSAANRRLEDALCLIKADAARAVDGILDNRVDAIRGLAQLAETTGLEAAASSLRRLPRLPFSPVAPPKSPERPKTQPRDPLSLLPSHQISVPWDRPVVPPGPQPSSGF